MRNTVTGALRAKEKTRDSHASASVARKEALTTPLPRPMASRYTAQPAAPVSPVNSSSRRGEWKMTAKAMVAAKATPVCKSPVSKACNVIGITAAHLP